MPQPAGFFGLIESSIAVQTLLIARAFFTIGNKATMRRWTCADGRYSTFACGNHRQTCRAESRPHFRTFGKIECDGEHVGQHLCPEWASRSTAHEHAAVKSGASACHDRQIVGKRERHSLQHRIDQGVCLVIGS